MTVAGCLLGSGFLLVWSSWDEFTCTAGEATSSGPCGVGIDTAGAVFLAAVTLLLTGAIVLWRASRRPVDPDGAAGWRVGQAYAVLACGVVYALMVPRYACPGDTRLSAVFRFCVSHDRVFRAPSPGLAWKFAALGVGIALFVVLLAWRRMPWPVATAIVVASFLATSLLVASRTTGIPGTVRHYEVIGLVGDARGP